MTLEERQYCLHLLGYFQIEGRPACDIASEGQIEIFYELIFRHHKRLQILCATQYGKSLFVALACIVIACVQNEMICILAPTDEKAKIIMRYFVEHLGDHEMFHTQLEKKSKLDRLRMEDTKDRIVMRKGGGIFMISVQAGNSKKGIESAMGAGAKIVIQDESGLIPDSIEATVFRMIAGKGPDAFYCKIGNPFYRNHFLKSHNDQSYHHIFIDYLRGLAEGRYVPSFIEEARTKPYFDVLYECKFPNADLIDDAGYIQLVSENQITIEKDSENHTFVGRRIMGIDPSGAGKDLCSFWIRDRFTAKRVHSLQATNPKQMAQHALMLAETYKVAYEDIVIDAFGSGSDVSKEMAVATKGKCNAYSVLVGNHPKYEEEYNMVLFNRRDDEIDEAQTDLFLNIRALMFFRARKWLITGGVILDASVENSSFKNQMSVIKYKELFKEIQFQIMGKVEMQKLGIPSPNDADAFALTFLIDLDKTGPSKEELELERQEQEVEDPHSIL